MKNGRACLGRLAVGSALGFAALLWAPASFAQRLAILGFWEQGVFGLNRGAQLQLSVDLDSALTRSARLAAASDPFNAIDLQGLAIERTVSEGLPAEEFAPIEGDSELGGADPAQQLDAAWAPSLAEGAASTPSGSAPAGTGSGQSFQINAAAPKPSLQWAGGFLRQLVAECVAAQTRSLEFYESAATRARYAAVLPSLTLRAGRNTDRSLRLTPSDSEPNRYQLSGGYDYKLEAQASWDLQRLVFADQEVSLGRLRHWVFSAQRDVTKQVLGAAFRWQKALALLGEGSALPEEQLGWRLDLEAAAAELDVLSGGWFQAHYREAWIKP